MWLIPAKRKPVEELSPRAVEPDAPPRRGVIGPEDYLPPRHEELLERVFLERSAREQEEMEERIRRELLLRLPLHRKEPRAPCAHG